MTKILFIHSSMDCGGVEQALFDLINLLDKNLFDVSVLLHQEGGEWEKKFKDAGIRLTHVYDCQKASRNPVIKGINLIKRKRLNRAWKQNGKGALNVALPGEYDLIVKYGAITFDEMCFYKNAKTIAYIHGDVNSNEGYRAYIERRLKVLSRYDRIVCVSEIARTSFAEMTGITENVTVLLNPLDSNKIKKMSEKEIFVPRDVPVVCAVGRLSEEKGFVRLVRIHKHLLDKGYAHQLVIVGEGPERGRIEEEIRQTSTQDSVFLAGYQENPYPYMKQSKFLVCSSYTEGLPVIAMEALSLGIPVVSAVPSIGELFGEEKCGLITENDDHSLEAGIERMLRNGRFYDETKVAAHNRSQFFQGERMVKEVETMFIELLK